MTGATGQQSAPPGAAYRPFVTGPRGQAIRADIDPIITGVLAELIAEDAQTRLGPLTPHPVRTAELALDSAHDVPLRLRSGPAGAVRTLHTRAERLEWQGEWARHVARLHDRAVAYAAEIHAQFDIVDYTAPLPEGETETADRHRYWHDFINNWHVAGYRDPAGGDRNRNKVRAALRSTRFDPPAGALPPETDLAAYRAVHAERLRDAGERRLRHLLGDAVRAISSHETAALGRIESTVRDGQLRIARAATAAEIRTAYAASIAIIDGVRLAASPRWRLLAGAGARVLTVLPQAAPVTLLPVATATPPIRAAVLEAWSPPATPTDPATASTTLIERATSADPAKLRARIVRGPSRGIDRLELDWLTATPGGPVTVEATARNVHGPRDLTLTAPAPLDPED